MNVEIKYIHKLFNWKYNERHVCNTNEYLADIYVAINIEVLYHFNPLNINDTKFIY